MIEPLHVAAATYGCAELVLAALRRSSRHDSTARSHDRGSLQLLWVVIAVSMGAAVGFGLSCDIGRFELGAPLRIAAWCALAASAALRVWSIVVLGRFFTVDVAIRDDHQLVVSGPFRVLRHPSYTGVLGVVASLFLLFGNAIALGVGLVGVLLALLHRIRVEERALAAAFGDAWTAHCARTWRLVPFVW